MKYMEFCLRMDEKQIVNLWVRIKEKIGKVNTGCVTCYGPPDQEHQPDKDFYRQIGEASCLQALVLMGDFNYPICWWENRAGHKQSRKFLECVDDKFLFQVIEDPMRRDTLLDLILTNKVVVGTGKVKRHIGCSFYETVKFRILRATRRVKIKLITLDFRRAELISLRICLEESSRIRP